jgi:hypothetical protein
VIYWVKRLGLVLGLGATAFVVVELVAPDLYRSPASSEVVGSFQVIAGPDEAWLLVEKIIVADRPGPPIVRNRSDFQGDQVVVVFDHSGVKQVFNIPEGAEVTFNSNATRAFRHDGQTHIAHRGAVFRWNGERFLRLPDPENKELTATHGLNARPPLIQGKIDELTEQSGWKHLAVGRGPWALPPAFGWHGNQYRIEMLDGPGSVQLRLVSQGEEKSWGVTVMQCDPIRRRISWDEYRRLSD